MNFLEIIVSVKTKLNDSHNEDIAEEILNLQLAGGTGGEVLISVCSRLLALRRSQPLVYALIRKDAEELVEIARSGGLYPE